MDSARSEGFSAQEQRLETAEVRENTILFWIGDDLRGPNGVLGGYPSVALILIRHTSRSCWIMAFSINPVVRTLLFVLLELALAGRLSAQQRVFNAGLVGGLNFAELVGEGNTDYFGPNVGIIGSARFARHGQLAMELLYSQNGEYILPEYYPTLEYGNIALHHIEVPVHVDLLIGLLQHDAYYDWNLNIGVAYTQLIGYSVKDRLGNDVSDLVIYGNRRAMLLQAGTTYHFTEHFGLNFRASLPIRVEGLSWTWAARMVYMLG